MFKTHRRIPAFQRDARVTLECGGRGRDSDRRHRFRPRKNLQITQSAVAAPLCHRAPKNPFLISLACASATLALLLALATAPAPARAQAARVDTPTTIGGRRITTSGTIPRMDANTNTDTNTDATASKPGAGVTPRALSPILSGFTYQPPPPPKPQTDDEVDLRDIDKPQNEIIRLPRMTVTAKKPAVFTDRTLYTQDQLKNLAISRYLGALDKKLLNKWTFADIGLSIGTTNADRAMQMYLDDERLRNMDAAQQQIATAQATGTTSAAQQKQMQSDYYDMFLRPPDKVNTPPDSLARQRGQ